MVKQHIIAILILVSLLGCSAKNSASKNGAILGTTAGAMAGGVMGLAISASKSEKKDFTKNALIGAVVVGAIGYLTGSAMGYVVDTVGNQETKEIEKIAKSHKIVNKSLKHKPRTTPEAITDAQIANEASNENSVLDVKTEPREVKRTTQPPTIVKNSVKHKTETTPEAINDMQISNEVSNENRVSEVATAPKEMDKIIKQDTPHPNNETQEMSVVEISSDTISPITPTKIQSNSEEMTADRQENKTLNSVEALYSTVQVKRPVKED